MSWAIETIAGKAFILDRDAGCVVCEVSPTHRRDAPVLAAAPDLLAASRLCVNLIEALARLGVEWSEPPPALLAVKAAIEKAEQAKAEAP